MAEFLEVDQMLPPLGLEFKRQHRWILEIDGIDAFAVRSFARPSFALGEVKVDYINTIRYYTGKREWQTSQIGLNDPIVPSAAQKAMDWVYLADSSETGRAGYKEVYAGKSMKLKMLDPIGDVVELWTYFNPWPQNVEYGALEYSNPDVAQVLVTTRFDFATLKW